VRREIVQWLVLTYMGVPGGHGFYGRNRKVFYSDTAAPIIHEIIADAGK